MLEHGEEWGVSLIVKGVSKQVSIGNQGDLQHALHMKGGSSTLLCLYLLSSLGLDLSQVLEGFVNVDFLRYHGLSRPKSNEALCFIFRSGLLREACLELHVSVLFASLLLPTLGNS